MIAAWFVFDRCVLIAVQDRVEDDIHLACWRRAV